MKKDDVEMDRPTRHGRLLGQALADIAKHGREVEDEGPCCGTCAFLPGSLPNQCAGTLRLAMDCLTGVDASSRFACHYGLKEGEPTRRCAGYESALHAPRSLVMEKLTGVYRQLEAAWGGAPDEVRGEFDAWWNQVDPDRKMNIYQLARAYEAREKPVMVHNVNDRRRGWIGSWEVVPLVYNDLTAADAGRTVIYRDHGRAEAGTLSSWRNGIVFARYSRGDTAAGANPVTLCFGVRAIDGPKDAAHGS